MKKFEEAPRYAEFLSANKLVVADVPASVVVAQDHPVARNYVDLRTRVYKKHNYLNEDSVIDIDEDDPRSNHFVALMPSGDRQVDVVGSMRLINKGRGFSDAPLPVERLGVNTVPGATEVSRMIVEGGRSPESMMIRTRLFQVALRHVIDNDIEQTVAMVDPWFRDYLRDVAKVPVKEVAPEQKIDEYSEKQVGIDIDFHILQRNIGLNALKMMYVDKGIKFYGF